MQAYFGKQAKAFESNKHNPGFKIGRGLGRDKKVS